MVRDRVVNAIGLVAAFVAAGSAAWGHDAAQVLFGKALMSTTILWFSLFGFFQARLGAKLTRNDADKPPSTVRFVLGAVCAVAVGALAFSTLSNDFVEWRKAVTVSSGAAISAAAAWMLILSRVNERREHVR